MPPRFGWIITGYIQKNTIPSYELVITPFCRDHGNLELEELNVDLVQVFLESITNSSKHQTRKSRFTQLASFFNFIHNNLSSDFQNPCNSPMLRKLFRPKITTNWNIIEKDDHRCHCKTRPVQTFSVEFAVYQVSSCKLTLRFA
jgi:hypothetical protein